MGSQKQQGIALDPATIQPLVDGLLCRAPTSRVGALVDAAMTAVASPPTFVYCHVWSAADRTAFWRGLLDRIGEFGAELKIYFVWFRDAFFFGEREGDFTQAWESFANGIGDLATLAGKVLVVAGIPPVMMFHPKRRQYEDELKNLGLQIAKDFADGYKKAYKAGGLPQCTGRLLADLLRLAFELLAAKGAGKVAAGAGKLASSGKVAAVLEKLPGPLKNLPAKLAEKPTRNQLIKYIKHDKSVALHGEGVLRDLRPGEFLVRVEGRWDKHPGGWFNGPFKTAEDAQKYAMYLSDLGQDGIREVSALPIKYVKEIKEKGVIVLKKNTNEVDIIRIYKVKHETPAISSVVAPQKEGAARGSEAMRVKGAPEVRGGQGQQLSLPLWAAKELHGIDLVERVNSIEILIRKTPAKKP